MAASLPPTLDGWERIRGPYDVVRRPDRGTATKIRTEEARSQEASPLFTLPAELRSLIFEHLVGSGVVHLRERECGKHESWTTIRRYKEFKRTSDDASQFRFVDRPAKLSYATCQKPQDWQVRYALSQRAATIPKECFDRNGYLLDFTSDQVLRNYTRSHDQCVCEALRDFRLRDYGGGCSTFHPESLRSGGCTACQAQYERWTATHGPAPKGLKSFHANSGIDLRFLLTCRQAYKEAWHLPFTQYTYDFPDRYQSLLDFAQKLLYPHQRELLHTIHIRDWYCSRYDRKDVPIPASFLPGLRRLQLSFLDDWVLFPELELKLPAAYDDLAKTYQLESVEVISGCDLRDIDSRPKNREYAKNIEDTLLRR